MKSDRLLEIWLDETLFDRIESVARRSGISVDAAAKDAIDRGLEGPILDRLNAGHRILAADDMHVPEVSVLRVETEEGHVRPF